MRKIIVLSFISLDGVMQAPGGPNEDPSGGFEYGGWTAPFSDEASGEVMEAELSPSDLLLGRKTFEIFESYWPAHADYWPGINEVTKYVLSETIEKSAWQNCVFLKDISAIKQLKGTEGGNLKVWGSSQLVQLLLAHDLVDEFWLNIYPVVLGNGKKLFNSEAVPVTFTMVRSFVTSTGVIMANYRKSGEIKTGTFGAGD